MEHNDFIEIYEENVSQELCDELVYWFDFCSDRNFTYHNMPFAGGLGRPTLRSDEYMVTPNWPVPAPVSSYSLPRATSDPYWHALNQCYEHYVGKYEINSGEQGLSSLYWKIHKVKEGQGYHIWHEENQGGITRGRTLAWMTYLKVPEEGGETEFLYQSKRIEPIVGRTVIWPAYFTHMHRGNPPLKGEKYYITGWFERNDG
jgi:hypothetical protein